MPRRKKTQTEMYEEHEGIMFTLAWRYARGWGKEFDTCLSEAGQGFLRAYDKWDGVRPFGTYLWRVVDNGLKNYIKKEMRLADKEMASGDVPEAITGVHAGRLAELHDIATGLTPRAQVICAILFGDTAKVLGLVGGETSHQLRAKVVDHIKYTLGIPNHNKTYAAFDEIKEALLA